MMLTRIRSFFATLLGLLTLLGAFQALAASSPWQKSPEVEVRLLSAVSGVGELKSVPAGIEIKLAPHWKTYWRSPGDAGLPPTLEWKGSTNLGSATLLYPKPERFTLLGIKTFGYTDDLVLPVDVTPAQAGKPLDLKLKLDILVCAETCVPKSFDLALALPASPAAPDGNDALAIAKARAAVPLRDAAAGFAVKSVEEVSDKGTAALQVEATAREPFVAPDVIAEIEPSLDLGTPRLTMSADKRSATFLVPLKHALPIGAKLAGRKIIVTVMDGARAYEQLPVTIAQGASAAQETPGPSLLTMLGVALLGGLILNVMPCVLPVLSLKFLSVVRQGGRAPSAVRAGFLATAAGIIVSFLAIAAALIAIKAAGNTIGWGIQFQEPGFIAAMAVLVTFFACNMAGFFEVPLPRFVADAASARTGHDESLAGHFVTGAFATLLATPCSAPFLGTAVGFALAGGTAELVAIFFALGVGLALPYLVVAVFPHLAAKLPRPGRWMLIVKYVMAAFLAATAAGLLFVLFWQVGLGSAMLVGVALVAIAALLYGRSRIPEERRGLIAPAVGAIALAAVVLPSAFATSLDSGAPDASGAIAWQRFDRNQVRSLVSQGKTVFVDVTAAWCVTCKANENLVLSQGALAQRLNRDAVSMQADWTRRDDAILTYLASYGRYGIPFNIVYGPAAPSGIALPELLTTSDVTKALDAASKPKSSSLPPASIKAASADPSTLQGARP